MIIFSNDSKELEVPKGLGNVNVSLTKISSGGVTEEEVEQMITNRLAGYYTSGQTDDAIDSASGNTYDAATGYTDSALEDYYTSGETDEKIAEAVSGIDLSNYYTSGQTDEKIAEAISGIDLSDYYTSGETDEKIAEAISGIDLSNYYTSAQTNDAIATATGNTFSAATANTAEQISAQQFKTINGTGITGSGNIVIESGGKTAFYLPMSKLGNYDSEIGALAKEIVDTFRTLGNTAFTEAYDIYIYNDNESNSGVTKVIQYSLTNVYDDIYWLYCFAKDAGNNQDYMYYFGLSNGEDTDGRGFFTISSFNLQGMAPEYSDWMSTEYDAVTGELHLNGDSSTDYIGASGTPFSYFNIGGVFYDYYLNGQTTSNRFYLEKICFKVVSGNSTYNYYKPNIAVLSKTDNEIQWQFTFGPYVYSFTSYVEKSGYATWGAYGFQVENTLGDIETLLASI